VSHDINRHVQDGNIEKILRSANDSRNECKVSFLSITETNKSEIANLTALLQELAKLKSPDAAPKRKEFSRVDAIIQERQSEMQELVALLNKDLTELAQRITSESGVEVLTLIEEEADEDSERFD
jgi:hypothetical protein